MINQNIKFTREGYEYMNKALNKSLRLTLSSGYQVAKYCKRVRINKYDLLLAKKIKGFNQ